MSAGPESVRDLAVVITGSTRGFGLAATRRLLQLQARVVVSGPDLPESQRLVDEFQRAGLAAVAAPGDMTDPEQIEGLADAAVTAFGRLDVWVNNAAYDSPGMARALEVDPAFRKGIAAVNVLGTGLGTAAALRVMLPQERGLIVNISGRGEDTRPAKYSADYAASKAWIRSFTRTVAAEYADSGVQVVAFNPGMMLTGRLSAEATESVAADTRTMKAYEVVTRIMADPPEVAAEALARLIARAQGEEIPHQVKLIGPRRIARGLLAEARRRTGRRSD